MPDYLPEKIMVLDVETTNKIAAGEVIERPASVVKELIENALDAGAARIVVDIENGGLDKIQVDDDGHGIEADQLLLAFERHATSKIRSVDELFQIKTYGFRGEALPSIASVAKVILKSKTSRSTAGKKVLIEGGKPTCTEETAANKGTTIIVKNLFYNVPPRRKSLKSPVVETAQITHVVTAAALSNPDVAFIYKNTGRLLFQTNGRNNLEETIMNVFGLTFYNNLLPVNTSIPEAHLSVTGFISKPQNHRSSRHNQYLFINNRWVYSSIVNKAVDKALEGIIPKGRSPVYVLHIQIPHKLVDVNVHPSKKQVRFDDDLMIEGAVIQAIKKAIQTKASIHTQKEYKKPTTHPHTIEKQMEFNYPRTESTVSTKPKSFLFERKEAVATPPAKKLSFYPSLRATGQFDSMYILAIAEGEEGLYIIDQHAAHERIQFDRLKKDLINEQPSQMLVQSEVIDLTPEEMDVLTNNLFRIQDMGFIVEHFGDTSYVLRGVPSSIHVTSHTALFKDVLDAFINEPDDHDRPLKVAACHSSVTAKKNLSLMEQQELLDQLESTDLPYTCPHGRPTTIHITSSELRNRFNR